MTKSLVILVKGYPRLSETFIAQEILALEQAGLTLHIVSMRRPTDRKSHPIHRQIRARVLYLCEYLHHEPLRVLHSLWRIRGKAGLRSALRAFVRDFGREPTLNRLRRLGQAFVLAAEFPPEAERIHAHFLHTPGSVARYASLILGVPWSCSAHAKDIWTSPDWDLACKLEAAEFVVTCTKAGRDRLNPLAPPDRPIELVYHGLDFSRFTPMTGPRSLRDGQDEAHPVELLTVGRAVEKKGLDVLIKALALLPEELHWRWRHIGGGELRERLEVQARKLGIAARIEWLGPQDQQAVLAAYRLSDIFVLPCRLARDGDRDGLPNVLMEAQSQGLVCLSTQAGAVAELIEDGQSGLLVPPDDPRALAEALAQLIRDPALRRRLGRAGVLRVRGSFDYRAGVDRLLELFGARRITPAAAGGAGSIAAEP